MPHQVTGDNNPERDPVKWSLDGSNDDGASWVPLDRRHVQTTTKRLSTVGPFQIASIGTTVAGVLSE